MIALTIAGYMTLEEKPSEVDEDIHVYEDGEWYEIEVRSFDLEDEEEVGLFMKGLEGDYAKYEILQEEEIWKWKNSPENV